MVPLVAEPQHEKLEPATRAWILESAPVTLIDYLEAREQLIAFSRRVMRSWPAGRMPVTAEPLVGPLLICGGRGGVDGFADRTVKIAAAPRFRARSAFVSATFMRPP